MPTPKKGYSLNGKSVPGTTTICGRYKDTKQLMPWVYNCGRKGMDYRLEGRRAADIGTAVHDAIERHILGRPQEEHPSDYYGLPSGAMDRARRCFEAWKLWNQAVCPKYTDIEPQLVHPDHGYGGTIDAVGIIDDKRYIIDWKTSNGIYAETSMQVAAYAELWQANTDQHVDGALVLRMDKRHGKFEQYKLMNLQPYLEQFLRLLDAYKHDQLIFPVDWDIVKQNELLKAA